MRIQKIIARGNSQGVNIPKGYMNKLGWRRGSHLFLEVAGDALIVRRIPESTPGRAQAWLERRTNGKAKPDAKPTA